jgi:hypothetical protein
MMSVLFEHSRIRHWGAWHPAVLAAWLCLLLAGPAMAATIKATPDRDPVRMEESFNLVFSSEESVDDDPDFGPLAKDFEILGQNQGSQVSIVNGKMSRKQEWTVTLSPKHTGTVAIPPVAFGKDRSQPASVTVQEAETAAPSAGGGTGPGGVMLAVEVEPKDPYVQAQAIYTVRLWIPQGLRIGGNLDDPQIDDVLVERLFDGNGRSYGAVKNGQEYTVVERKYALFPQKSGLLRIEPLRLDGQVETGGSAFFSRHTQPFRLKSEAIDLKVRPIPAEFTGQHWLPAAELSLEESWPQDPPQAKAGEPVTRTLTLKAEGATVGVLPELKTDTPLDPSIKQYPDQPALTEDKLPTSGITAKRQEKAALIPGKAGAFKLPAVEISWWNTKTGHMEIAKIPERALTVEASGELAPAPAPAAPPQTAEPARPKPLAPVVQPAAPAPAEGWLWLALFFGAGWLATGLAWWRSLKSAAPKPAAAEPAMPAESAARQAVRQACARNDPAAARLALLAWGQAHWPQARPASLADIAGLAGDVLAEEIGRLNRALYGQAGEDWRGEGLWAAVEALQSQAGKAKDAPAGLEPLYRL